MPLQRFPLPRDVTASRHARVFLSALPGIPEDLLMRMQLGVSELVNNAVVHGSGDIELVLDIEPERIRCEVVDQGERPARAIEPREPDDTGGRGLHIVGEIADAWGVYDGTTHVWCEFRLTDS